MNDSSVWSQIFQKWPDKLPQRGVVVAAFGEQIPFSGFLRTGDALLLERQTPDATGARKIILLYSQIAGLKITDPVSGDVYALRGPGFASVQGHLESILSRDGMTTLERLVSAALSPVDA